MLALSLSLLTAWVTLFRRGSVKMTPPTTVFFGPDSKMGHDENPPPKLYLRTLLYSTGKKGRMIESMHAKIVRNETIQNFNVWVYGEDRLMRGSGLFVGEEGVTANHHFLAPRDDNDFVFKAGKYRVELYAKFIGDKSPHRIWSQEFVVSPQHEASLKSENTGLYFDWAPSSESYMAHIDKIASRADPLEALRVLMPREGSEKGA